MCGLVAVICKSRGGFFSRDLEVFQTLLYLDTLRGKDSTGVFMVTNRGNVEIAKAAIEGGDFIKTNEWKTIRQNAITNGWALVAHNRAATRGSITDENAHPFWVDDKLVLVHNGTMLGDHKQLKDTEVDSHAIAHVLAEAGSEVADVEKALQKINAAYALIWYDVAAKTIRVIRNVQRPLTFVETKDHIWICSEAEMLEFTLKRHNVTIEKDQGPWFFREHDLCSWTLKEDKGYLFSNNQIDGAYKYQSATPFRPGGHTGQCGTGWEENIAEEAARSWQERQQHKHGNWPVVPVSNVVDVSFRHVNKVEYLMKQYDWLEPISVNRWGNLKVGRYSAGSRLQVAVKDSKITDGGHTHRVVARTDDVNGLFVEFYATTTLLDTITAPGVNAKVDVLIDSVGWTALPNQQGVADPLGLCVIRAGYPQIISARVEH